MKKIQSWKKLLTPCHNVKTTKQVCKYLLYGSVVFFLKTVYKLQPLLVFRTKTIHHIFIKPRQSFLARFFLLYADSLLGWRSKEFWCPHVGFPPVRSPCQLLQLLTVKSKMHTGRLSFYPFLTFFFLLLVMDKNMVSFVWKIFSP